MRNAVVNAIIGMIATLFVLFGGGAWKVKEDAVDHHDDVARIERKLDRVLDAICASANAQRVCRSEKP